MKKILISLAAGAALTLSAGTAVADGYGYGSTKDAVPMVAPQANWSGLYIGAAVGYGIASTDIEISRGGDFLSFDGLSSEGFQGTLTLGYDRQIHPNVVLGVFGDYTFGNQETDLSTNLIGPEIDLSVLEITDSWAIGARLGFVRTCCTMLYATAGYAHAELEALSLLSKSMDGWFIGGGIEHQLMNNIFLKFDYRYTDYGKVRWANEDDFLANIDTETDVHSIRLGVNWKVDLFGGHHAAPAYDSLK